MFHLRNWTLAYLVWAIAFRLIGLAIVASAFLVLAIIVGIAELVILIFWKRFTVGS